MKNDDRDELDDVIDAALPGYSSADPVEGLADRVLHRIHLTGAARRSLWPYRWVFALPALAVLLFVGIALWMRWNAPSRATNATRRVAVFKPPSPAPWPQLTPAPALREAKPKRRIGTRQEHSAPARSLPKEEYFPTPVPITDEERALVAWAGRAPAEAIQAFAELRKRSDETIAIQPIEIPPLRSDGAK
jgi:hypothetical protein